MMVQSKVDECTVEALKVMPLCQFFSHWSQCWIIGLIYNVMYGHMGKKFEYILPRLWPSSSIKLMV